MPRTPMKSLMLRRARHHVGDDRGFTLVELLVAISLLMVVLAGAVPVLISSVNNEPRLRERAGKIQEARALMERLGRDLRSGYFVDSSTSSTLALRTYLHQATCNGDPSPSATAILCRVSYSCASGSCTRQVANPDGSSPGTLRTLVSGLSNSAIFSYSGSPTSYIQVSIVFPAKGGDDAVTLTDGFGLRNVGLTL
jgi:prepilin-type N-terminal cleavage/methylation domain-containing protein